MAQVRPVTPKLTPEAYLADELGSTTRHKFIDGQVFAT